jgi:hypothetical protein
VERLSGLGILSVVFVVASTLSVITKNAGMLNAALDNVDGVLLVGGCVGDVASYFFVA